MATHDKQGNAYARLDQLLIGSQVKCDGDFTCLEEGSVHSVCADLNGELYIVCDEGKHYLDGQLDDDIHTNALVGLYPA